MEDVLIENGEGCLSDEQLYEFMRKIYPDGKEKATNEEKDAFEEMMGVR